MNAISEATVMDYIRHTFDGLDTMVAADDTFFFYDPGAKLPKDRRIPFATLVTRDAYDRASNLDRPGVFRVNMGVRQETYRKLFGDPPKKLGGPEGVDTGHDYTQIDTFLPHPIYAAMSWICVLCPDKSWERTKELLAEAHSLAREQFAARMAHRDHSAGQC